MIPILYEGAERAFVTNGIGRLPDCITCTVTEERNGVYECEFTYPITGERYSDIQEGRIVAVTHDDTGQIEPFDIYGRSAPINGVVTFYAHHVSYRLADIVVKPFTAQSASSALYQIGANAINHCPFYLLTDKSVTGEFKVETPRNARGLMFGEEGSILDVFGPGEYSYRRFTVNFYSNRGTDSGVEIRYGKNLTDITHNIDTTATYNAVIPFWQGSEGSLVMLPELMLVYSGAGTKTAYLTDNYYRIIRTETEEPIEVAYQQINAVPMDLSSDFEEAPTAAQLRTLATSKFNESRAWLPKENITVDFVQLWQTEEYADVAPLQRVRLCDTVSVYYPELGVEAVKQKVIKTVYNVLLDRYDSIELGSASETLAQTITGEITGKIGEFATTSAMTAAIENATNLITGGLGGYVVMNRNANGEPQEILIMDSADINSAVNAIRMNKNGIGFSTSGYAGPFRSAWTIDGAFVADFITSGTLNANLIRAGTITDDSGKNYWNLASGNFVTKQGTIANMTIDEDGLTYSLGVAPNLSLFRIYAGYLQSRSISSSISFGLNITPISGITFFYQNTTPSDYWDGITQVGRIWPVAGGFTFGVGSDNTQVMRFTSSGYTYVDNNLTVSGNFRVSGTKNRAVQTYDYGERLLYSYETPTPLFGDIGEAVIDEDGYCFVSIDDIFSETIEGRVEYQVFLQKEGPGDCWIEAKERTHFVISGTPGLKVAWELKAKQRDYDYMRLETDYGLDEYETAENDILSDYIQEQEALLYG